MKALAKSQDIIGYCNFMEGYILAHFYAIQNLHLAMSSSVVGRLYSVQYKRIFGMPDQGQMLYV